MPPSSHDGAATARPTQQFALVQALRGLAAGWVVLFHAAEGGHVTHLVQALPAPVAIVVFESGDLGVAIFFALSGFVIAYSVRGASLSWPFVGRFALRRSIRLDPAYWASILLVVALAFVSAQTRHVAWTPPAPAHVAAHLVYLQGILGMEQINPVYWTLTYEVQFYLVFIVALVAGHTMVARHGRDLAFAAFFVLALASSTGALDHVAPGLFVNLWHCFFVGVLACWATEDRRAAWALALLAGTMIARSVLTLSAFAGASAATALLLVWTVSTGFAEHGLNWRWLQFLGAISYSLYLTHNPVTGATAFGLHRMGVAPDWTGDMIVLLAICVACIAFSAAFWSAIERPSHRLSRRVGLAR